MEKDLINKIVLVGSGLIVGGAGGHFITKHILKSKYEARANEEIESVKETYKLLRKEGEYSDPTALVEASYPDEVYEKVLYEDTVVSLEYVDENEEQDPEDRIQQVISQETVSIFDNEEVYSDGPTLPERDTSKPYIISFDEYFDGDDFTKMDLTYFEEDNVLCDGNSRVIPDVEYVIGDHALSFFGQGGSDNEDIVYVRNEQKGTDYEITKDENSFTEVVIGYAARNAKAEQRKMRADD